MAYAGQGIKGGTFTVLDTSGNTYNGSNVTFNLGTHVSSPAQLLVSHDGVIQKPGTDYSLATGGTQITFSTAPASGASIFITEISGAVGAPMNRDINGDELILDADADTSITADTDDQIDIRIGGSDIISATASTLTVNSGAVFNEDSADVDFRVESNGSGFAIAVDGGNDTVGLLSASATQGADVQIGYHDTVTTATAMGTAHANDATLLLGGANSGATQGSIYLGGQNVGNGGVSGGIYGFSGGSQNAGIEFVEGQGDAYGDIRMLTAEGTAGTLVEHFRLDEEGHFQIGAHGGGEGLFIYPDGSSARFGISVLGGEAKGSIFQQASDQGDDNADWWAMGPADHTDESAGGQLYWASKSSGSWDNEMAMSTSGVLTTEGAMNASTTVDYAEYFEWKTELANDAKITETYGMTVVLDGDKVRLAEAGEEAKVIGVIRPNDTSAMVGGSQELKWKDKYVRNNWGEIEYEEYTQATWYEGKTKHSYAKDMIPSGITAPSTNEEKTATSYSERTTYNKDKGTHKKGDKLLRQKINSSYNKNLSYKPRSERRKEWAIVGLLGQVPIKDTAIIPTTWTKMKNIETGLDLYFIK